MTIKVFEAFSGIGAQAEALKELGIDYDVVGISEIDKFAIKGYEAIHGHVKNYGDIRDMSCLPEARLPARNMCLRRAGLQLFLCLRIFPPLPLTVIVFSLSAASAVAVSMRKHS